MKVKIISDGTPPGTRVVNADTGEPIEHVTAIEWKIDVRDLATAVIRLRDVDVDVVGEATTVSDR